MLVHQPEFCESCGHSMEGNAHGFDQNDAYMDGDKLIHSGKCTYCIVCFPGWLKLRKQ